MVDPIYPIVAQNGQEVGVRFLTAADGELLVDLVRRLSPNTRYLRFLVAVEDVPVEAATRKLPAFLAVDGVDSVALMALVKENGIETAVGVARFNRNSGSDDAEVAVVIRDDWQRQGIGQVLMKQLAEVARQLGIKRFCAVVLATNRGAHALIKGLGYPYQSHVSHGEDEIVIYLEENPK
jgi:acetyltransferase